MTLPIPKCPVAAAARQEGASEPEGGEPGEAPRVHVPTSVSGRRAFTRRSAYGLMFKGL